MQAEINADLINQLAAAINNLARPAIPIEIDLWDIATIAAYFKRSEDQVRQRMACLPDFPKAIRPPSKSSAKGGQALYPALEVIAWAKKYRDKN
jgi:hypothetical protein